MNKEYIFHSTCYDRQLLRRIILEFNENTVEYRLENIADKSFARDPGGGYFETEIYILGQDFARADELVKRLSE